MISLIVPTHNDESRLVAALAPLVPASMEGLIRELIILDGGSSDATLEIAEDAGANILGSPAGVSDALAAAKGPWIMVIEPNVLLQPGWEEAARAHMATRRTAARFQLTGAGWFRRAPMALLFLKQTGAVAGVRRNRLDEGIGKVDRLANARGIVAV